MAGSPLRLPLLAAAVLCFSMTLHAQQSAQPDVYAQLANGGPEAAGALGDVLKAPGVYPSGILYLASAAALRANRIEDAGFLLSAAQLRKALDDQVFPPTETGDADPMVALEALNQETGAAVNPAIMRNPQAFSAELARVKAWKPEFPPKYNPGWDYKTQLSDDQAHTIFTNFKTSFFDSMTPLCTLLQDGSYFTAFKTMQDFNLKTGADKPSQADYDAAIQTMKKIETDKGIPGFATQMGN
jgi:hypothetical protein